MKKFTCKDLGGSCEEVFIGETPDEVMEKGKQHMMANMQDEAHTAAIKEYKEKNPMTMEEWYEDFKKNFDNAPDA